MQRKLWAKYLGHPPSLAEDLQPPPLKTPTAEPQITRFEGMKKGDFAVLASDGLWDSLSSEEVVGLVGKWVEEKRTKAKLGEAYNSSELPVVFPDDYKDTTTIHKFWGKEKRFISDEKDEANVARHLLRNAMGGADKEFSDAVYRIEGPRSRKFR